MNQTFSASQLFLCRISLLRRFFSSLLPDWGRVSRGLFRCVYLALCMRVISWGQCLCTVCVCEFVCASYQGSSPSLNKPFVYLGCSLLWAGCPPGCCLSALFKSLIKAHLSLSTLSLHPPFHSFNHFPVICSCSLQMFLLYFSFYALAKLSSLCHLVISSFTLFSIPHPWHCLPVPFSLPSAFPLPPSC